MPKLNLQLFYILYSRVKHIKWQDIQKSSLTESKHGSVSCIALYCQLCTFLMHLCSSKSSKQKPPSLKFCLKTASATIVYVPLEDIVKFRDRLTRTWEPNAFEKESAWWLGSFLCFVVDVDMKSKCLQLSEEGKLLLWIPCLKSGLTLSVAILKASFTSTRGLAFPH